MDDDDMLFGAEPLSAPAGESATHSAAIGDWQVAQLRHALDGCGIVDMKERRQLIESLVGRPVASLHEITAAEVRLLLEGLHARAATGATGATSGSSWDNRDEDTWIDRI